MKFISAGILSAALATGLGGAVLTYQLASGDTPGEDLTTSSAAAPPAKAQVVAPGTRFRWAPCPAGSQLEAGVCVTDVVRTVVIPAPAAPVVAQAPAPAAAGNAQVVSAQGGEDREGDDRADNGGGGEDDEDDGREDGGEDDGDDDGADDD